MFIRELKKISGSVSIQLISKSRGRYRVIKSFCSATRRQEIDRLKALSEQEKESLCQPRKLFISEKDKTVEEAFFVLANSNIHTISPGLFFGKIFDYIGFNAIDPEMF